MLVVRTKRDNRQRVAFFKARRTGRRRKEIKEKKKRMVRGEGRIVRRYGNEKNREEGRRERCEIRKIAAPSEINV